MPTKCKLLLQYWTPTKLLEKSHLHIQIDLRTNPQLNRPGTSYDEQYISKANHSNRFENKSTIEGLEMYVTFQEALEGSTLCLPSMKQSSIEARSLFTQMTNHTKVNGMTPWWSGSGSEDVIEWIAIEWRKICFTKWCNKARCFSKRFFLISRSIACKNRMQHQCRQNANYYSNTEHQPSYLKNPTCTFK